MEKLLTVNQVADLLGVKTSTIYQWTHEGFIPHVKIGNRVRFKVSQIEKWLEKKSIEGRSSRRVTII